MEPQVVIHKGDDGKHIDESKKQKRYYFLHRNYSNIAKSECVRYARSIDMGKIIIASIIITCIFLYSMIFHITQPLGLGHGDYYLVLMITHHWMKTILMGNFSGLLTLPVMYGIPHSLFFTDHQALQAMISFPIHILTGNIFTSVNVTSVVVILLSMVAMAWYVYYLTKQTVASIVAGIIFVFNPYVMARYPDQIVLYTLFCIPAIFFCVEHTLKHRGSRAIFFLFLFLSLQLLSGLYYSVFLTVLLPVYIGVRIYQTKSSVRMFFTKGTLLGGVLFAVVVIGSYLGYRLVFQTQSIGRDPVITEYVYAAWPVDWLFASDRFVYWGQIGNVLQQFFGQAVRPLSRAEMSLFWGIIPIVLMIMSIFIVRKTKYQLLWYASVFLIILTVLLSFGPRIHGSHSVSLPNIYLILLKFHPLFGFLRSTFRIAAFTFFFVALICGLVVSEIERRISRVKRIILGTSVVGILLLEFWTTPLRFEHISAGQRVFYETLRNLRDINVIVDLPIGNMLPFTDTRSRSNAVDSDYYLWQVLHGKKLLNGYAGFEPEELHIRGNFLTINFPTAAKLDQLRKWGVDAMVLHRDEFGDVAAYETMRKQLLVLGIREILTSDGLLLYDLN